MAVLFIQVTWYPHRSPSSSYSGKGPPGISGTGFL